MSKILIVFSLLSLWSCKEDENNSLDVDQLDESGRIYGGYVCPDEEFARIVSIRYMLYKYEFHFCAGSLISRWWVLTAAHCRSADHFTLYAVAGITRSGNPKPVVSKIAKKYIHDGYRDKLLKDDIALFSLEQPIDETKYIKHMKVPEQILSNIQRNCPTGLIKGWGVIELKKRPKDEHSLQCLEVPINNADCARMTNPELILCFVHPNSNSSACSGDSGGPMTCKDLQIGVASFASMKDNQSSCDPLNPQGYTRIDKYLGFIKSTMEARTPGGFNSANKLLILILVVFLYI